MLFENSIPVLCDTEFPAPETIARSLGVRKKLSFYMEIGLRACLVLCLHALGKDRYEKAVDIHITSPSAGFLRPNGNDREE